MDIELIFMVIVTITIVIQLITIIYLSIHAITKKMSNIGLLALGYFLCFISTLLTTIGLFSWNDVAIPLMTGFFSLLPVTYLTFHKNMHKNYTLIITIGVILAICKFIAVYYEEKQYTKITATFSLIFESLLILFSFGWFGHSALKSYHEIKSLYIENWIKIRLKILGISSWIFAFEGFPQFLQVIFEFRIEEPGIMTNILYIILVILIATYSIGNLLAWVMPTWEKQFWIQHDKLNKNSGNKIESRHDTELSEEEILNVFKKSDTKRGNKHGPD